jgi:predicted lactoylglutathione lyase
MKTLVIAAAAFAALVPLVTITLARTTDSGAATKMELGNFSVSLAVKDLGVSRAFYEKLGFKVTGGQASQNWLILQNQTATVGLFQGMFEKNLMTFNPGWSRSAEQLKAFEDVRDIQARLLENGIVLTTKADAASQGPASFTLLDPDGNMILVDQHVPKPGK